MRNFITCNLQQTLLRVIKSRKVRGVGHLARMEEMRTAYKILVGKPREKRPLRRLRRRWKDNIRMDLYIGSRLT